MENTAKFFNALYPQELLKRFEAGERDFTKINLLRKELEHILGQTVSTVLFKPANSRLNKYNLLWADFHNPIERQFEWDNFGAFIPVEYHDLLPKKDLSGVNFININLSGSYLFPVNFSGSNLHRANFRNAVLHDVDFSGADLSYADLRGAMVYGNLQGANLYMAKLERCTLNGCDLRGTNLRQAKLQKANLVGADLRKADLRKAHFDKTVLNGANLKNVDFYDVKLDNVFIAGAIIDRAQQSELLKALSIHVL